MAHLIMDNREYPWKILWVFMKFHGWSMAFMENLWIVHRSPLWLFLEFVSPRRPKEKLEKQSLEFPDSIFFNKSRNAIFQDTNKWPVFCGLRSDPSCLRRRPWSGVPILENVEIEQTLLFGTYWGKTNESFKHIKIKRCSGLTLFRSNKTWLGIIKIYAWSGCKVVRSRSWLEIRKIKTFCRWPF